MLSLFSTIVSSSALFIAVVQAQSPTFGPTLSPTYFPTLAPTFGYKCPAYSATKTASATRNYQSCTFSYCPGTYFNVVQSTGTTCSGDNYLRIVDTNGVQYFSSDDFPGQKLCSEMLQLYLPTNSEGCAEYILVEGCYDELSCSGQYSIVTTSENFNQQGVTQFVSQTPSTVPNLSPTFMPVPTTSVYPTTMPSVVPTHPTPAPTVSFMPTLQNFLCPYFNAASYTTSGEYTVGKCEMYACGGSTIVAKATSAGTASTLAVALYNTTGDLLPANVTGVGGVLKLTYTLPITSGCHIYELQESCKVGSTSCSGQFVVSGAQDVLATQVLGYSQFLMPAYSVSSSGSTGPSSVEVYSCDGGLIGISGCGAAQLTNSPITIPYECTGDTMLTLYNDQGQVVATNDDSNCGLCASLIYRANKAPYNSTNACFKYTIVQSCYPGTYCSVQNYVLGASKYTTDEPTTAPVTAPPAITIPPSFKPTLPTAIPTAKPTSAPSFEDQYCVPFPQIGSSSNYTKCVMQVCSGYNLVFELSATSGNGFYDESNYAFLYAQNGQQISQLSWNYVAGNPITGVYRYVSNSVPTGVKSSACQYFVLKQYCSGYTVNSKDVQVNNWGRCVGFYQIKAIKAQGTGGSANVMNANALSDAITGTSAPSANTKQTNSLAIAAIVLSAFAICGVCILLVVAFLIFNQSGGRPAFGRKASLADASSGKMEMNNQFSSGI